MTIKAVIPLFLLFATLVAGSEYLATWIEGPNGAMPDLANQAQVQDSKGNIWLFGGSKYDYVSAHYNHVWKLDVRNNYTWSEIQSWPTNDTGNYPPQRGMEGPDYRPPSRKNSLIWVDRDDNLWMTGGTNDYWITYITDLWMFNTSSRQWKLIHEPMPAEWGTKGAGEYNVTFPGDISGAVTWTDFESNELWFLSGGNAKWRSDVWKYNIASGVWTWMAGPKEVDVPRSYDNVQKGVWYSDDQVNRPPVWAPSGAIDRSGDVWFHGGNIPGFYISNELWRFRPSTLQWMWVSGNGTGQSTSVTEGQVQPPASLAGTMAYVGNNILLYWCGWTNVNPSNYMDLLFAFNMTSNEWQFISGTLNESAITPPQYGKFHQADASNYPGTRGDIAGQSMGSLWIVRGTFDYVSPDQHRDTFVFSVNICQTDLNPCGSNAKCTARIGYADCACNAGYEGDGYTCNMIPVPTKTPTSAKASDAARLLGAFVTIIAVMISLI